MGDDDFLNEFDGIGNIGGQPLPGGKTQANEDDFFNDFGGNNNTKNHKIDNDDSFSDLDF